MLDAIHFEELGVPGAAILTAPFASTGRAIAELRGFSDYSFAAVPHPIGSLTPAEADALADAVTSTVVVLLTSTTANATQREVASLDDIVDGLAEGLRTDGADLTAEISGRSIRLQLHIPDDACAECVMPASMLTPMFRHRIEIELGPGWNVTLDDPREVAI